MYTEEFGRVLRTAQACAALGLVLEWQTNCNLLDTVFTNKTGNVNTRHISGFFVQKCCRGKEISVTYYECVCSLNYPACNAHGHIVICGLPGPTIFSHIIS